MKGLLQTSIELKWFFGLNSDLLGLQVALMYLRTKRDVSTTQLFPPQRCPQRLRDAKEYHLSSKTCHVSQTIKKWVISTQAGSAIVPNCLHTTFSHSSKAFKVKSCDGCFPFIKSLLRSCCPKNCAWLLFLKRRAIVPSPLNRKHQLL